MLTEKHSKKLSSKAQNLPSSKEKKKKREREREKKPQTYVSIHMGGQKGCTWTNTDQIAVGSSLYDPYMLIDKCSSCCGISLIF